MADRLRLGILATHPVQYHIPLFRSLAADPDLDLTVYFAHRPSPSEQGAGFGVSFEWDVDLTSGYQHEWLVNIAPRPGVTRPEGCDTPSIRGIIARNRFDAFLVMGWHSRSYRQAIRACWQTHTPVMVRGDSQLTRQDPLPKRAIKRAVYPIFMRRFSACLSVGIRSDAYFRHYGARRIVRVPHYVDNAFFAAPGIAGERARLRQAWGVPADATVCLFVGKFLAVKRPLDLVRSLALNGDSGVWGVFVGDGEFRHACETEAARLGVSARFVGFMNQQAIRGAYRAADFLVLPSERETWGLVVNEAMASGRSAFVSDAVGCAPDLIVKQATGDTFPVGDIAALAALLRSAASQPGVVAKMGESAKQHVSAYSVEAAHAGVALATRISAGREP